MTTILIGHEAGLGHDMGEGHPERPDRLRAVEAALSGEPFAALRRMEAPEATPDALMRVHPEPYVEALLAARPRSGQLLRIDADTAVGPGTVAAALRGSGGAVLAVDEVLGGRADNAFVAMRPPGHHAERATAMGFCFFNHAAVAARHARAVHGAARVAILDWDVHHGNGTQDVFWSDPGVMYASTHQMPLFPGTGARGERGDHDTIVNAPLRAGDGAEAFRAALDGLLLPRIAAFRPDLVIVSAGFDAHRRDPLGQLELDEADFGWATRRVMDLTGGKLVSLLEGGYDLRGLALSAAAHVTALLGTA
ncbi:histone deacetylase family protein [Lichenibacterium minor]|uniref:Histone deacetylase family protein n=1 Tax=Lichenibacterium minor TaxID=2316528 RepID=A0A4Q2U922_9HYPH|nr:histone deacetylase family protein [Lichenibacterium minor]RYC31661.1 histone deacetylase family protein [Lichenibacterium minor]